MASTGLNFANLTPDNGAVRDLKQLIFLSVLGAERLGSMFNVLPNQKHGEKVGFIGEFGLLGKPIALYATKSNHKHKGIIEVEDTCEGMVEFENGLIGNFFATNAFCGASRTSIFVKTTNHMLEIRNAKLFIDDKLVEDTDTKGFLGKEVYGDGHLTLIKKFYEAIESGAEMPITLESAQWALRLLLAAYESNDERTLI